MKPGIRSRRLSMSTSPIRLWAEDAVGYRPDDDVPEWERVLLKVVVGVGAIVAVALAIWLQNRGELPRIRENTQTLYRLDEFTKNVNPAVKNAMPAFLALPGTVGVLAADGSTIKDLDDYGLRDVVCAPNVAVLVRQEFPGYYEHIPDDRLEKMVLQKHPDYRDRLCALPAWMDATTHDIVKYQLKPLPPFRMSVVLWAFGSVMAYVLVMLNIYYRVLVRLAASAPGQTPISSFHSSGRA